MVLLLQPSIFKTMNKTNPSSNEWLPFYQQIPFMDEQFSTFTSFSDAKSTVKTTGVVSSITSYKNASLAARVSKPRRRSRSSNKTPITLLKANTSNFRSVVQQFTGCSRRTISFGNQNDPFSVNFNSATSIVPIPEDFCNTLEQEQPLQHSHAQDQHSLIDNFSRTPTLDSSFMNTDNSNYMEIKDYENVFVEDNSICYYDPFTKDSISTDDYWNDGNYLF